ncbi:MAG: hypothetical protein ACC662_00600 [Planctomycetota bacterium]
MTRREPRATAATRTVALAINGHPVTVSEGTTIWEAANLLTSDLLDPYGKIPGCKFSAVRIEKA